MLLRLIPSAKPGGRRRHVDMQAVVNAILYILCAGCAWRMLRWHDPYFAQTIGIIFDFSDIL